MSEVGNSLRRLSDFTKLAFVEGSNLHPGRCVPCRFELRLVDGNTIAMIMSPDAIYLAAIGPAQIFWIVLALFILWPLLRSLAGAGLKQKRADVLARMGFSEMPASQAFGDDAGSIARAIRDTPHVSISSWAGKGNSSIGQTSVFELTDKTGGSSDALIPSLVVAFATSTMLPEFEIAHLLLLDHWFKQQPIVAGPVAGAAEPTTEVKVGPFRLIGRSINAPMLQPLKVDDHPEFAKQYGVWAADEAAVRPRLKPALIDRLCALQKHDLHIKSWRNWLFIYHRTGRQIPAEQYPGLLDEAVELARIILQ
jgi:hypothetical protein